MNDLQRDTDLAADILHVQKPRSDEQLSAFVAGQHDTEARRWQQVVIEISIKLDDLEFARIKQRQLDRKIAAFDALCDSEAHDEADLLRIAYRQNARAILGAERELETLYALYQSMPRFTRAQIEADEKNYWRARTIRQAINELMACGRIQVGNLDQLRQLGIPLETVFVEARECLTNFHQNLERFASCSTSALPSPATLPTDAQTSVGSDTAHACVSANLARSRDSENA